LSDQARAQIALQDGSPLSIADSATGTTTVPITVTAGANVLVVLVEDHGATVGSEPSTLSLNAATLTNGIQEDHTAGTTRGSAIYYLYNPPVGSAVNLDRDRADRERTSESPGLRSVGSIRQSLRPLSALTATAPAVLLPVCRLPPLRRPTPGPWSTPLTPPRVPRQR